VSGWSRIVTSAAWRLNAIQFVAPQRR
jgi:hypothetical protein